MSLTLILGCAVIISFGLWFILITIWFTDKGNKIMTCVTIALAVACMVSFLVSESLHRQEVHCRSVPEDC